MSWWQMNRWVVTGLIFSLAAQTACSLGRQAAEMPCHQDKVQTSPGVFLPLSSGQTYQVYPTDNHISMMWRPLDRLMVCPIGGSAVEMTNLSDKGEKIRGIRISNWNGFVWPY